MVKKVLSLTEDGRLTYCSAPVDQRGKGRCNHIAHQEEGQTIEQFLESNSEILDSNNDKLNLINKIKENPEHLKNINQTPEICMAAVKQNGLSLKYINEQNREMCVAAVRQNGLALEFVKKQDKDICIDAVTNNRKSIKYVNEELKTYISGFLI